MFGDEADLEEAIIERVVAAAHEAAFVLDARGDVIACNDVAAALVGATREGVLGRSLVELGLRPDTDASGGFVRALLDPEAAPVRRDRFVLAEPSGGQRLVRVSRASLGGAGGAPWILFVSRWDMRPLGTPEQLHEERLASIGRLTAAVTHDFNNVLAVLLATGELLVRKFASDDPRRALARDLVGAAVRGSALTRALLALSRLRGDGARLLDVNGVVRDLASTLDRLVGDDVELVLRLEAGTAEVRVDPLLLEQVLLNLATNARDAMPAGGRITFTTVADADLVTIEVADTGLGMDPDTSHRIFDPFFTTKPRGHGTGLGLASARAIIDRHGGRISVESEPGRGSRFTIRLPVAHGTDDESETGGPDVVDAATGAGTFRLLGACLTVVRGTGR